MSPSPTGPGSWTRVSTLAGREKPRAEVAAVPNALTRFGERSLQR
jgi:hypothetical protein